jgi:carbon-monoxide dehydrogenase large subunit
MAKFGIGQSVRRVEDLRLIAGLGRYVDDITLPGQCFGAMVYSPHAHARIQSIDTARAKASLGVLCVLTGADADAEDFGGMSQFIMPEMVGGSKGYRTSWRVLATDKVRFVGERVAFVVAENLAQARDAAELIDVDYQPLSSATNIEDAIAPDAPKVWEGCQNGNIGHAFAFGDKARADAAFAKAKHVVSLQLENNRLSANAIEPRATLGDYDSGTGDYTLYTSTQNPHGVRGEMAQVLHLPETRIRVIAPDVGGGFGMKYFPYPEDAVVLWASRVVGRPVKWTATRSESLIGDAHGRDQVVSAELALDESGKILALRSQGRHAVGCYYTGPGIVPSMFSLRFQTSVYDIQTVHVTSEGVFTNTSPVAPYRGAGRPEAIYIIERLLDRAAEAIGLDQVEIRRRNMIKPEAMPYKTPTMYVYDSGEFERLLDRCLAIADWNGFAVRQKISEENGKRRGRGLSMLIEFGGIFNERMELRFDPTGALTIIAGTFSHGQGHATTYAQMVSQWLGVPFETVRFVQGDTDLVPFGRGTHASRSATLGGSALKMAADAITAKAKPMAAFLMEAEATDLVFENGEFRVTGTDKLISITNVAKAFYNRMGPTSKFGVGLEASGTFHADPPNFPNGCHCCEVEVDVDTGEVTVDRYVAVDDVGRAINPLICHGQVHGALAQGIGQALMEHAIYDRDSGQFVSGSFMDYAMPRASNFPKFISELEEVPAKTNPLGVKGIGETGSIGAPPAVINALLNALKPLGVDHIDMPATPSNVWETIRRAQVRTGTKSPGSRVLDSQLASDLPVERQPTFGRSTI